MGYRALELPGMVQKIRRARHIALSLGISMRMYRSGPRRRWPRSRAGGCLLWLLLLIVLLIVLSLMFGGFQKGTRSGSLGGLSTWCTSCTSASVAPGWARRIS